METEMNEHLNFESAHGWEYFIHDLYQGSWSDDRHRYCTFFAFRGLDDASSPLTTSLQRLGGEYLITERKLLRNFKKYAREVGDRQLGEWEWLSIAQHHGLPTRLMDWTYSPLVALHFATANMEKMHLDGAIWCVNVAAAHKSLSQGYPQMHKALTDVDAYVFTTKMLDELAPSLDGYDEEAKSPSLLFFEPPSLDQRIVNQYAIFSVMTSAELNAGNWLKERPELYRKITIPAHKKWEIRDKLDCANISERVLFPGMDGLSKWLARNYAPRP